jgi:hypothetical protein
MARSSTAFSVSDGFHPLLPSETLGAEVDRLVYQVTHMAQRGPVTQYKGQNHTAMLCFQKDGYECRITVMACPTEPLTQEHFICGAASIPDSLAVYYVDGLRSVGLTATIHRTVAGHPIVEVTGRGWYRVEMTP